MSADPWTGSALTIEGNIVCPQDTASLPAGQSQAPQAWLLPELGTDAVAVYAVPSVSHPGRAHLVTVYLAYERGTTRVECDLWCPGYGYHGECRHTRAVRAVRALLTHTPDTELAPVTPADRAALEARAERPVRWISGAEALRRLSETEDAYPVGGRR